MRPRFAFHLYHLLQQTFCGLQGSSYWAQLLSMDSQEVRYCSVHKQCDNQARPRSLPWQAVYVQCAPLLAGVSSGQLLCNVLQRHMRANVRPCGPCTAHQQRKMAAGKSTSRPEAVIYDTVQAVRLPVVLLVSVWSLQASPSCVLLYLFEQLLKLRSLACIFVLHTVALCVLIQHSAGLTCAHITLYAPIPRQLWHHGCAKFA